MVKRLTAGLLLAGFLFSANGCALVKFGYLQVDFFAGMFISRFLDLSDRQSEILKKELTAILQWHRTEEIPVYASQLNKLATAAPTGISAGLYDETAALIDSSFNRLLAQTLPAALRSLPDLTDDQVVQLRQKMEKENQAKEEERKERKPEDQFKKRFEGQVELFETFLGDLEDSQLQLIRDYIPRFRNNNDLQAENRKKRQTEFLTILENRKNTTLLEKSLRKFLFEKDLSSPTEQANRNNRALTRELVLKIEGSLTRDQREHLAEKIIEYRDICRDLMITVASTR